MGQFVIWKGKRYLVKNCFHLPEHLREDTNLGEWWVNFFDDDVEVFGERTVPANEVTAWEPSTYLEGVIAASEHQWSLNGRFAEYNQYQLCVTNSDRVLLGTVGYVELMQIYAPHYVYHHVAFLVDLAIQWHEDNE